MNSPDDIFNKAKIASSKISKVFGGNFDAGLVLGSGLSLPGCNFPDHLLFSHVFGLNQPKVAGHPGKISFVENFFGCRLLVTQGRYHYYEGYSPLEVILPILTLAELGVNYVIFTNAAGALNPSFKTGDLMIINDHINLTGTNPLIGMQPLQNMNFVDMTEAYDKTMKGDLLNAAHSAGIEVKQGVYVGVSGPSYETLAELEFMRRSGGDAIGMSTVLEVIGARFRGLKVAAISVITNQPANESKVEHSAVIKVSSEVSVKFSKLIAEFCKAKNKGKGD